MKLLVLSGVPGSVDAVVDIIQQSNSVVAKELTMTNDAISRASRGALESGSCDLVLVVAKDPIGAGMLLNKQEGIEAAVCDSAEDARLAKGNGANVIVIRDVSSSALGDILGEVSGPSGVSQRARSVIKMPSFGKRQEAEGSGEERENVQRPAAKDTKKIPPRKQPEEDNGEDDAKLESLSSQRKGVVGRLKNALGIL